MNFSIGFFIGAKCWRGFSAARLRSLSAPEAGRRELLANHVGVRGGLIAGDSLAALSVGLYGLLKTVL